MALQDRVRAALGGQNTGPVPTTGLENNPAASPLASRVNATFGEMAGLSAAPTEPLWSIAARAEIDQREREQGVPLDAGRRTAIFDAYEQYLAGTDEFKLGDFDQRFAENTRNRSAFENYAAAVNRGNASFGAGVVGVFSPETAQAMERNARLQYGDYDPNTTSGFVGETVASVAQSLPTTLAPVTAPLVLGASQTGQARMDAANLRAQGKQISAGDEWANALLQGAEEFAGEYIGGKIAKGAGAALGKALSPGLKAAIGAGDKVAIKAGIVALIKAYGGNATEEAVTQVMQNATRKMFLDPEQGLFEGSGRAALQGGFAAVPMAGAQAFNTINQEPGAAAPAPGTGVMSQARVAEATEQDFAEPTTEPAQAGPYDVTARKGPVPPKAPVTQSADIDQLGGVQREQAPAGQTNPYDLLSTKAPSPPASAETRATDIDQLGGVTREPGTSVPASEQTNPYEFEAMPVKGRPPVATPTNESEPQAQPAATPAQEQTETPKAPAYTPAPGMLFRPATREDLRAAIVAVTRDEVVQDFAQTPPATREQATVAQAVSKATGGKAVVFFQGEGAAGFVLDEHPNVLFINRNAAGEGLREVMVHESWHKVQDEQPQLAAEISAAIAPHLDQAKTEYLKIMRSAMGDAAAARLAADPEDLEREAAAWVIGQAAQSKDVFRAFTGEKASLLQRFVDFIRSMFRGAEKNKLYQQAIDGLTRAREGFQSDTSAPAVSRRAAAMPASALPESAPLQRDRAESVQGEIADLTGRASRARSPEVRAQLEQRIERQKAVLDTITGRLSRPKVDYLPQPSDKVRRQAADYAKSTGRAYTPWRGYAEVDPKVGAAIAQAYAELPHDPDAPAVQEAYGKLKEETLAQWEFLKRAGAKLEAWTQEGQPYADSKAMMADVAKGHLWFFTGGDMPADHPLAEIAPGTDGLTYNDVFRAVHDYFGHAKEGYGFGPRGEENAWLAHSSMYSPLAQAALTTETRGQNSWVNYGPHGEQNRKDPANTRYAEQKAGILPAEHRTRAGVSFLPKKKDTLKSSVPWRDRPLNADTGLFGEAVPAKGVRVPEVARIFQAEWRKHLPVVRSAKAKIERFARVAIHEMVYQLDRPESGKGWYSKDIAATRAAFSELHPELADDGRYSFFATIMGIMSQGNKPDTNLKFAEAIYAGYKADGSIPHKQPNGMNWPVNLDKEVLGDKFDLIERLLKENGGFDGYRQWLTSKHPVSELREYGNVSGAADSLKFGAEIFGPKIGPFILGIQGVKAAVVKDMWFSRTWNRIMGTLVENGETVDAPRNDEEREQMEEAVQRVASLSSIDAMDVQAILWFYEKELYHAHGAPLDLGSYSKSARKVVEERTNEQAREARRVRREGGAKAPPGVSTQQPLAFGRGDREGDGGNAASGRKGQTRHLPQAPAEIIRTEAPNRPGFSERLKSLIGKSGGPGFEITDFDRTRKQTQDSLWPLVKAMREVVVRQKAQGVSVDPADNPETLLRLTAGVGKRLSQERASGLRDSQGAILQDAKTGEALTEEWLYAAGDTSSSAALKKSIDAAMHLGVAQRTIEQAKRLGRETDISGFGKDRADKNDVAAAREYIAAFQKDKAEYDRAQEVLRRYRLFADQMLKQGVDTGFITREDARRMKDAGQYYVNMQRVFDDGIEGLSEIPGAATFHKFRGSDRLIDSPLINLLATADRLTKAMMRNQALAKFVTHAEQTQSTDIAVKVEKPTTDSIRVRRQGEVEHWQVDGEIKTILDTWGASMPELLGGLLNFPGKLKRAGVTLAPAFRFRNLVRDTFDRAIKSDASSLWEVFKGIKPEELADLEAAGGSVGLREQGGKVEDYYNHQRRLIEKLAGDDRTLLAVPRKAWEGWQRFGEWAENINRVAEFRAQKKKAMSAGMNEYNATLYAAAKARDLLDFAISGTAVKHLNRVMYVPFLNASIQGLARDVATVKQHGATGTLVKLGAYAVLPSLLAYGWALTGDDDDLEEYRQLPAWRRDYFWNFKVGEVYVSIPKPFSAGVIGSGVERIVDLANGNHDAFVGYWKSLGRAAVPVDESAIVGPFQNIVENMANHSFFFDREIVPPWEEGLALDLRNTDSASRMGQWLSRAGQAAGWEVDPRKIDHIVAGFGGTGQGVMQLSDLGSDKPTGSASSVAMRSSGLVSVPPGRGSVEIEEAMATAKRLRDDTSPQAQDVKAILGRSYLAESLAGRNDILAEARDSAAKLSAFYDRHGDDLLAFKVVADEVKDAEKALKKTPVGQRPDWHRANPDLSKLAKRAKRVEMLEGRIRELRKFLVQPNVTEKRREFLNNEIARLLKLGAEIGGER